MFPGEANAEQRIKDSDSVANDTRRCPRALRTELGRDHYEHTHLGQNQRLC